MRVATYIGGLLGLALLLALAVHADLPAMTRMLGSAGWSLLWLVPYRALFYLLYAAGWLVLLSPDGSAQCAGFGFTLWVTAVREAIDRLLPVASIGGGMAGVRLMRWRGLGRTPVGASVIVETLLTLVASYVFTAAGLLLLVGRGTGQEYRRLPLLFLFTIPVPVITLLLLRHGSVFARLQKILSPLVGLAVSPQGGVLLDRAVRASTDRRGRLAAVSGLQFLALLSGAFEVWFALRLFGRPVNAGGAVVLESMTLALRHVAFFVPAGIGVQEAGMVLFGHAVGIDTELALAVSMAKRMRELCWGVPALISWQWVEGRRL